MPTYVARVQALGRPEFPGCNASWATPNRARPSRISSTQSAGWLVGILASLWTGGKAAISFLSLIVVMPVVTFYLIVDWHALVEALDGWMPRAASRRSCTRWCGEIDRVITGFLRGQSRRLPDPRHVLCDRAVARGAQLRPADRGDLRPAHLRALCRLDDRAASGGDASRSRSSGRTGPGSRRWSASSCSDSSSRATSWRRSWSARMSACIRSG